MKTYNIVLDGYDYKLKGKYAICATFVKRSLGVDYVDLPSRIKVEVSPTFRRGWHKLERNKNTPLFDDVEVDGVLTVAYKSVAKIVSTMPRKRLYFRFCK